MPLAFKRFHDDDGSDTDFLPMISEVLIVSQPAIQNHPNIVNLEGICWEIKSRTEKAVPVFVFEKAAWHLQQFMNVSEGRNMSMNDRLNLCADIGSAIGTLHEYNIIHGDIKPQNVLICNDATGKTIVKVADFRCSTLAAGEGENICLPKSRPWNAPEHHFGEFTAHNAKQTDNNTEYTFDAPGPRTALEQLKYDDKLQQIANQFIDSIPLESAEHRNRLREIFSLAVPLNPSKKTSDLKRLVGLLSREQ
ncbi:kinase-like domain-containing protein [Trichophaea hybrida]|nr:kinase-like domain-containing protein [Trichophaea hybrida]